MKQEPDTGNDQDEASTPDTGPGVFLLEAELAARWRVSSRTIQRRRAAGRVPPYLRQGLCAIYRLADVEAFEREATISGNGA